MMTGMARTHTVVFRRSDKTQNANGMAIFAPAPLKISQVPTEFGLSPIVCSSCKWCEVRGEREGEKPEKYKLIVPIHLSIRVQRRVVTADRAVSLQIQLRAT